MSKLALTFGLTFGAACLGTCLVYQAGNTITSQTAIAPSHPAAHRLVNPSSH